MAFTGYVKKLITKELTKSINSIAPLVQQKAANKSQATGGIVESVDSNGNLTVKMDDGTTLSGLYAEYPTGPGKRGIVVGGVKFIQ